ncbi:MAG: glycosyltransferase family 2 protein [Bdellovibrionales bacterium]|nr:glycosyltransferase family 2 protein [Bdellovibrionales bacterium]
MFISLVFPCHNEEKAISDVLPKAIELQKKLNKTKQQLEIIVIDDASEDKSIKLLQEYVPQIKLFSLKKQKGYGAVLKKAFQESQGDWFAFCDLDSSCQPSDLEKLIDLAKSKDLDIIWGNRLNKKSKIPFLRLLGNRFYQIIFFLLTLKKVSDPCSGFRLLKKKKFSNSISFFPNDLSFSIALTSYCVRYKIPFQEINISYKERKGTSKLHVLQDGFIFLFQQLFFLYFKKIK